MLTKTGKSFLSCLMVGDVIPMTNQTSAVSVSLIPVKGIDGNSFFCPAYYQAVSFNMITGQLVSSGASGSNGVAIGSGTTPPTENDYTLESQITGITASSPAKTFIIEDNKYKIRYDYSIQNDTGSTVVISELGLFRNTAYSATKGGNAVGYPGGLRSIMIDRIVLETPITIPNGQAGTLRYEFSYDPQ